MFAAAHYYWMFGTMGLDSVVVGEVDRSPHFLFSMAVISTLFVLSGMFALALGQTHSGVVSPWLRFSLPWGAVLLLLLLAAAAALKDLSALTTCAAGGALALLAIQLRCRRLPHWVLRTATLILGIAMMLYGGLAAIKVARHYLREDLLQRPELMATVWFGAWWFIGGILFTAAAWLCVKRTPSSASS